MRRFSVLMTSDAFLPHAGGAERVIWEMGRRLVERGHSVHVLTFRWDRAWPACETIRGLQVIRFPVTPGILIYPTAVLNGRRAFADGLAGAGFDVLHGHLTLSTLGPWLTPEGQKSPKAYTFYGPWHAEMSLELGQKPLPIGARQVYRLYVRLLCLGLRRAQGWVLNHSDKVIVLSEYSRSQLSLITDGLESDRARLIPGGVDLRRFRPAADRGLVRERLGLPRDKTLLLTIRRLVPRMGLEALLQAFATLDPEANNLHLVIGGKGRLRTTLEQLTESLGISRYVTFAGFIPEGDLPGYYQAADLFMLPTQTLEGFGLITLEALASGVPVVGTPVGSTVELLEALEPRFLARGTDPQSLSEAILRALDLLGEPGWQQRCRNFASNYGWESIVDRYEQLYTDLVPRS